MDAESRAAAASAAQPDHTPPDRTAADEAAHAALLRQRIAEIDAQIDRRARHARFLTRLITATAAACAAVLIVLAYLERHP